MPPKRPIKPALQQPQQIQQADPQSQQNPIAPHPEHGTSVPMQYGQPHGGGNVGGINVGFHQPHHPHHPHHQIHTGVMGSDGQLVMDGNTGNTGKILQQKPDQRISEQGDAQSTATAPQPPTRKRSRVSKAAAVAAAAASSSSSGTTGVATGGNGGAEASTVETVTSPPNKKSRTNTPWTPQEEQRLKAMRDAGNSWSEIAKTFPTRTEGSVKKHWYKDMHYAEFGEDESAALLQAIKEYEGNKWKVVGQKVGKPAKACEAYAKEHFAGKA